MNEKKANKKIALRFLEILEKIDQKIDSSEVKKELKKDLLAIQKELDIKPISEKELKTLKEYGVI